MLKNFKQLQRSLTPHTVPQRADDEKTSSVFPFASSPPPPSLFLKGWAHKESFPPIVLTCAHFYQMPNYR